MTGSLEDHLQVHAAFLLVRHIVRKEEQQFHVTIEFQFVPVLVQPNLILLAPPRPLAGAVPHPATPLRALPAHVLRERQFESHLAQQQAEEQASREG